MGPNHPMWSKFAEYVKSTGARLELDLNKPGEWAELWLAFQAGAIYGADLTMKAVAKSFVGNPGG